MRFDPAHATAAEVIAEVLARHDVSDLAIVEPELDYVIRRIYDERS